MKKIIFYLRNSTTSSFNLRSRAGFKTGCQASEFVHEATKLPPCTFFFSFKKFIYLFIYLWLLWVFVAARSLSLAVVSGGYSSLRCAGFSLRWLLLLWSMSSRSMGFSSCASRAQQLWLMGSVVVAHGLQSAGSVVVARGLSSCGSQALEHRLSSCGARAQLLRSMRDLPGPGHEPVSPALAGRFLTTAPPGKPLLAHF